MSRRRALANLYRSIHVRRTMWPSFGRIIIIINSESINFRRISYFIQEARTSHRSLLLLSKAGVNGKIINFKCHLKCVLVRPSHQMHQYMNDERKRHITAQWIHVDMHSRTHKSESIECSFAFRWNSPDAGQSRSTRIHSSKNPHLDIFSISNLFDVDSFRSTFSTLHLLIVDVQSMVVVGCCSMLSRCSGVTNATGPCSWMGLFSSTPLTNLDWINSKCWNWRAAESSMEHLFSTSVQLHCY